MGASEHGNGANGLLRTWMLAAIGCAAESREAVYVSTPITTGRRFLDWMRGPGRTLLPESEEYRRGHLTEVVGPNRAHVTPLIRDLRKRLDAVVIDPTFLEEVPGWEQFDYHGFWAEVIRRYVHMVVLADGWQYSSGCAYEVVAALEVGADIKDERLEPVESAVALDLVREAASQFAEIGLDTAALDGALTALAQAAQEPGR